MSYICLYDDLIEEGEKLYGLWKFRLITDPVETRDWKIQNKKDVSPNSNKNKIDDVVVKELYNTKGKIVALRSLNKIQHLLLKQELGDLEDSYIDEDEYRIRKSLIKQLQQLFKILGDKNKSSLDGRENEKTIEQQKRTPDVETYNDKDRTIEIQNEKIKVFMKKVRNKNKPPLEELRSLADNCRFKNGKINYSEMGKQLGYSNHTVRKWCDSDNIK
ncbi:MAG: hypothetical protein HZB59_10690 [Ignavibacteriales bacterium]|nr:hypothetical protein [Ignavibacteriales bacterium]